jgi:hypothetical protein
MTRRLFGLIWALLSVSCLSKTVEASANHEAEMAKRVIASELRTGSSESEIVEFFRRHRWPFDFDSFEQRFRSDVYRAPEKTHTVMVYVYVNEKREFVRSDVEVAVTFF